ncbi:MAG TPA: SMP-30/gluconolactonase/LRE family protein [Gemmatimonadaceae bacterium]
MRSKNTSPAVSTVCFLTLAAWLLSCSSQEGSGAFVVDKPSPYPTDSVRTTAHKVGVVEGLYGPESVRYSPDQDSYFVSVMNGPGSNKDNNGYIVQIDASNLSRERLLVVGGRNGIHLDAPKGLAIHGDTLWATDIDVLRAFDRHSGLPLGEIDLKSKGAVLLNDVAVGPDGTIYVTDTGILMSEIGVIYKGGDKVFAIGPNRSINIVAHGNVLGRPNGVTWDPKGKRWVVVSFDTWHSEVYALHPSDSTRTVLATGKGRFDGIEALNDGRFLVSCWQDSSVHLFSNGADRQIVRNVPSPADIGIDTKRGRLAIPTGTNRVEFWDLAGA